MEERINDYGFSFEKAKEILNLIYSEKRLIDKLILSGGLVPWIVSNTDSQRKHGDIDLTVKKENMSFLREILIEYGLYDPKLDSITYQEENGIDFGIEAKINGISVGFYPYEIINRNIYQRSFTPFNKVFNAEPEFKTMLLENVDENDFINIHAFSDGIEIQTSSLEVIKVLKEMSNREKDGKDVEQIDAIGYDNDKYLRLKKSIKPLVFVDINELNNVSMK